jgi:hypothetical protein
MSNNLGYNFNAKDLLGFAFDTTKFPVEKQMSEEDITVWELNLVQSLNFKQYVLNLLFETTRSNLVSFEKDNDGTFSQNIEILSTKFYENNGMIYGGVKAQLDIDVSFKFGDVVNLSDYKVQIPRYRIEVNGMFAEKEGLLEEVYLSTDQIIRKQMFDWNSRLGVE